MRIEPPELLGKYPYPEEAVSRRAPDTAIVPMAAASACLDPPGPRLSAAGGRVPELKSRSLTGRDEGTSIVEMVVAVLLLSIFSIATAAVVAQSTRTSSDNRSRIAASGLAQRELELAANAIVMAAGGVESLLSPDTVANPSVTAALASGDPVFAYQVGGERFRVERRTARQVIGAGSPCEVDGPDAAKQFAALVEVTVTWAGMSPGTKPHVASSLFAPHRGSAAAAQANRAVIGVKVAGTTGSAPTRPGMKVRVTGPGVASEAVTDVKGCAVFEVVPSANGTNYEVALLGPADSAIYVNPAGESQPSVTAHYLRPGDSRTVTFEDYEQAASLTVTVDATLDPTATSAAIGPHSGGAGNIREVLLVDGKAEFDLLSPGIYTVWAGASTPVSVTLGPGEHGEVSIP